MKTIIDKETIEKNGLSLDEFILIMLVGNEIDIEGAEVSLKLKGLIIDDKDAKYGVVLTRKACRLYEDIVMEASNMLDEPIKYEKLAEKLIDIYPKGMKDSTYQWADGPLLVARRLQMFELKYGKYKDEDIINATQKYVDIMFGKPEMRLLKYFIFKEKPNGMGENESSSDLYTMIVNREDTLFQAKDWKNEMK